MKELIDSYKLDTYLKLNRNVLFVGEHGVGKTSVALAAFKRAKLKYLYFSASTCDPFIDFVGVPRVIEKDGKSVLELIRQEYLQDESVEAIFIDEYNRAPKKMKNAVMELIQFKSINGRKYPNLKVVWAAVNPDDLNDTYDVEPLDPAQEDRFHIKIKVPYAPCPVFLENTYGEPICSSALTWWEKIPAELLRTVSPRRLCYALDFWLDGGDLRDILPDTVNASLLVKLLADKPIEIQINDLFTSGSSDDISKWINIEYNITTALPVFKAKPELANRFLGELNKERLSALLNDSMVFETVLSNLNTYESYADVISSKIKAGADKAMVESIQSYYIKNGLFNETVHPLIYTGINEEAFMYQNFSTNSVHDELIALGVAYNLSEVTTVQKEKIWSKILTFVHANMDKADAIKLAALVEDLMKVKKKGLDPWQKYDQWVGVINSITHSMFIAGMTRTEIMDSLKGCCNLARYSIVEPKMYMKLRGFF